MWYLYYILHITYYILHITYYILHITYYILHITYYILHITYFWFYANLILPLHHNSTLNRSTSFRKFCISLRELDNISVVIFKILKNG